MIDNLAYKGSLSVVEWRPGLRRVGGPVVKENEKHCKVSLEDFYIKLGH